MTAAQFKLISAALHQALGEKATAGLVTLVAEGATVVIDGKHGPTGKTTLCEQLRMLDCNAYEQWELDENRTIDGEQIKKSNDEENQIFIAIRLNKDKSKYVDICPTGCFEFEVLKIFHKSHLLSKGV